MITMWFPFALKLENSEDINCNPKDTYQHRRLSAIAPERNDNFGIRIRETIALNSLFEQLNDRDGSVGVQSSGWFIKKEHLWFDNELHSNTGPLPLSARHSTNELSPNLHTPVFH